MKPLRVAILGGSFNPPTIAHMEMGRKILTENKADKLVYIPCGYRSDKLELVDGRHRLNMLLINIESNFMVTPKQIRSEKLNAFDIDQKVLVDDYEIRVFKTLMPTALLLQRYQNGFPHIDFKFVMGSDLLESIRSWEFYEEVLKSKEYLIFERDTYKINKSDLPRRNEVLIDHNLKYISSTKVRNLLAEMYSSEVFNPLKAYRLKEYLNNDVLDYIVKHDLYRPDPALIDKH